MISLSGNRVCGSGPVSQAHAKELDSNSRITIEPGKCGGRPCIRGMRIRVTDILALLGAGASCKEILADYPDLQANDIFAALNYAAVRLDRPDSPQ